MGREKFCISSTASEKRNQKQGPHKRTGAAICARALPGGIDFESTPRSQAAAVTSRQTSGEQRPCLHFCVHFFEPLSESSSRASPGRTRMFVRFEAWPITGFIAMAAIPPPQQIEVIHKDCRPTGSRASNREKSQTT